VNPMSETIKALNQRINELLEENKKLSELNYKTSMEVHELKKKNKELEATIEEMSERIVDLEACK
jgi:predicted nuclease with TOPRIM domain